MARFSMEQVENIKAGSCKCINPQCREKMDLIYTIESQQQEIDKLQAIILADVINSDFAETYDGSALDRADQYIEKLEQEIEQLKKQNESHTAYIIGKNKEIEQLRAQAETMREALERCSWYGEEGICIDETLARKIMDALKPHSGNDYHNTADVETLKQAREALETIQQYTKDGFHIYPECVAREAIAAIDKIGGGEK